MLVQYKNSAAIILGNNNPFYSYNLAYFRMKLDISADSICIVDDGAEIVTEMLLL